MSFEGAASIKSGNVSSAPIPVSSRKVGIAFSAEEAKIGEWFLEAPCKQCLIASRSSTESLITDFLIQ